MAQKCLLENFRTRVGQEKVYRTKIRDIEGFRDRIVLMPGRNLIGWLLVLLLANGARVLKYVLRPKADTLNTPCSIILFKYKNKVELKFIIDK